MRSVMTLPAWNAADDAALRNLKRLLVQIEAQLVELLKFFHPHHPSADQVGWWETGDGREVTSFLRLQSGERDSSLRQ